MPSFLSSFFKTHANLFPSLAMGPHTFPPPVPRAWSQNRVTHTTFILKQLCHNVEISHTNMWSQICDHLVSEPHNYRPKQTHLRLGSSSITEGNGAMRDINYVSNDKTKRIARRFIWVTMNYTCTHCSLLVMVYYCNSCCVTGLPFVFLGNHIDDPTSWQQFHTH